MSSNRTGDFLRLCPGATLPTMRPALSTMPAVRRSSLLLALLSLGCQRFPDDTPVEAYRSFLIATRKDPATGDVQHKERTLELLSGATRQALITRAAALSVASGGSLAADPVGLLVGSGRPAASPDVSVKFDDGDTAVLAVTTGGTTGEVHLRREAGRWRISVPALEQMKDG